VKIRPRRQKWAEPIDSLFLTLGDVARRGNQNQRRAKSSLATIKKSPAKQNSARDKKATIKTINLMQQLPTSIKLRGFLIMLISFCQFRSPFPASDFYFQFCGQQYKSRPHTPFKRAHK
jgi:hypothetical protein